MEFNLDFKKLRLGLGDRLVFRTTGDEYEVASSSGCDVKPVDAKRTGPSSSLRLVTRRLLNMDHSSALSDREIAAHWLIHKGMNPLDPTKPLLEELEPTQWHYVMSEKASRLLDMANESFKNKFDRATFAYVSSAAMDFLGSMLRPGQALREDMTDADPDLSRWLVAYDILIEAWRCNSIGLLPQSLIDSHNRRVKGNLAYFKQVATGYRAIQSAHTRGPHPSSPDKDPAA
jgi:hypothetical protein